MQAFVKFSNNSSSKISASVIGNPQAGHTKSSNFFSTFRTVALWQEVSVHPEMK
jgi:hypothetical protein